MSIVENTNELTTNHYFSACYFATVVQRPKAALVFVTCNETLNEDLKV